MIGAIPHATGSESGGRWSIHGVCGMFAILQYSIAQKQRRCSADDVTWTQSTHTQMQQQKRTQTARRDHR